MRLVTFNDYTPGLLRDGHVVDLSPALGEIAGMAWDERVPALIAGFDRLRPAIDRLASQDGAPTGQVRLRSPNPRPRKLLCELGDFNPELAEPKPPTDFALKSPESVVGPNESIVLPNVGTDLFRARGGIALVIGRPCRNVSPEDALSYVFGYTGFIDVSAPEFGRQGIGTFFGSSFDTFGPMGPCVVTADEIGDPHGLAVRLLVNNEVYQDYKLAEIRYPIPEQIAAASAIMTLQPGDMIISGQFRQDAPGLHAGDSIVLEINGIGDLRETVASPLPADAGRPSPTRGG